MIAQPLTGILMTKHLFVFLPTAGMASTMRAIYLPLACWGFVLMCLHAGTHLEKPLDKLPKAGKAALAVMILFAVLGREMMRLLQKKKR